MVACRESQIAGEAWRSWAHLKQSSSGLPVNTPHCLGSRSVSFRSRFTRQFHRAIAVLSIPRYYSSSCQPERTFLKRTFITSVSKKVWNDIAHSSRIVRFISMIIYRWKMHEPVLTVQILLDLSSFSFFKRLKSLELYINN